MPRAVQVLLIAASLATGALAVSGCAATVGADAASPRLARIGEAIWVVEDYPCAVYYYDGYYWRADRGVWYRSDWYADGWVQLQVVPPAIDAIAPSRTHVRYRAPRGSESRRITRVPPRVRDRRARPPKLRGPGPSRHPRGRR